MAIDLNNWRDYLRVRPKKRRASRVRSSEEERITRALRAIEGELRRQLVFDAAIPTYKLITEGFRVFLSEWEQSNRDIGLHIRSILEDPTLDPKSIRAILGAFPRHVIDRVMNELTGVMTGSQALIGVEILYRDGDLRQDYIVQLDEAAGQIYVTFHPKNRADSLTFCMRDTFEVQAT
jgi:hypothetical protein